MAYNLDALKDILALPEPYKCPTCPYCNGTRDPTIKYPKPDPWKWWNEQLKAPKHVVAPMVDQSELPFRMLCRKYGATLCYTPMFHAQNFSTSEGYRQREFTTCPEDRPLVVQFCGNDGDTVLSAARFVEGKCDAVDLNLGCPQGIAKRGEYGSFLMERWDVIHTILHTLAVELKVPVTAKMRVFDDLPLTLRYARMLRDTGIQLLTVHGRTREMKGQDTGIADLEKMAAVKREITNIPVIANGNVLCYADVPANLAKTKCDAIMSAEALLWDPRLFANVPNYVMSGRGFGCANKAMRLGAIATTKEYLALVLGPYPVPAAYAKTHMFKMLYHSLECHPRLRDKLGRITNEFTGSEKASLSEMMKFLMDLEKIEQECDIDDYEKRLKDNVAAERAAAEAAGLDPDKVVLASGSRRQPQSADYASAVDESIGDMFI